MAKIIPLTQGQVTIVDDEDFDKYGMNKWYAKWDKSTKLFYATRSVHYYSNDRRRKVKTVRLHRVIMEAQDGEIIDHRNHNTLDNRRLNLRAATMSQNLANRKGNESRNTSGYRGVTWNKKCKKWQK